MPPTMPLIFVTPPLMLFAIDTPLRRAADFEVYAALCRHADIDDFIFIDMPQPPARQRYAAMLR